MRSIWSFRYVVVTSDMEISPNKQIECVWFGLRAKVDSFVEIV